MSELYYEHLDQYPRIVRMAIRAVKVFVSRVLYPFEYAKNPKSAYNRIIISDHVGPEFDISLAIESFKQFSANLPFTSYAIEAIEDGEIKNWPALAGQYYFSDAGRKGGAIQQNFTMNFTSFFSRADDYWQAMSRLKHATSTLTRLYVPIKINENIQNNRPGSSYIVDSKFTVDIHPEISQGELAFKFKSYLQENTIYDLSHTFKLSFYDFGFSDYMADMEVLDMIFRLDQLHADKSSNIVDTLTIKDDPIVLNISPYDKQPGVSDNLSAIVINFNNPMLENDTEFLIKITPPIFDYDIVWSQDSRTLTFDLHASPYTTLQPNTQYEIEIPNSVQDIYGHNPELDHFSNFTTLSDPY